MKLVANFIILALLLAIAYAQSPLFTSNQNQYFLHGFAKAGFGYLEQDWLANTLDPTPIFSLLIEQTHSYIGLPLIYYLYYVLLMGVYLYSIIGISDILFDLSRSRIKTLVLISLLIVIHSAALRFLISRTLGINWTYVLEDGLAGQRMLGPVLQPSTFGVFLILSIFLFLRGKPYLAVLSSTLAATVHPTYLLSAGILTLTYMLIIYLEERNLLRPTLIGLLALITISPIVNYVYTSFEVTTPAISAQARDILVNFRIPHHAIVSEWLDATVVIKSIFVITAIFLTRKTRLFLIFLVPTLIAMSLTIIQVVAKADWLALLFPWRISVFIFPLSTTIILAFLVNRILDTPRLASVKARKATYTLSAITIFTVVFIGGIRFKLDLDRKAAQPERLIQRYIDEHNTTGETYLIPVKMQDFRLVTGSPAFVDFKSIPYMDSDVLEWRRRIRLADQFYKTGDCNILKDLDKGGYVTHVIFGVDQTEVNCLFLEELYRDDYFSLMRINSPSAEP